MMVVHQIRLGFRETNIRLGFPETNHICGTDYLQAGCLVIQQTRNDQPNTEFNAVMLMMYSCLFYSLCMVLIDVELSGSAGICMI